MLISFKSKNDAIGVASILRSTGKNASAIQLPKKYSDRGCSFGVKIDARDFPAVEKAAAILKTKISRVYEVDNP